MGRYGNYNNYMNAQATQECYDIYRPTLRVHECFGTALQCPLSDTFLLARKEKLISTGLTGVA